MSSNLKRLALHLRERKLQNYQPYHLLLMPLVQATNPQRGYRHLAWLLQEGYFRTIVTLNRDTSLEDMLYGAGIQATILDINKDATHTITNALDDPLSGICIVKLYHDSTSDAQFADHLPSLPDEIRTSLKIYLQSALVIVGSVLQDSTLVQIFSIVTIKSVYYVLPQSPSLDDVVHEKKQGIFSIYGLCGEFTPFFSTLASFLQNRPDVSFPPCLPSGTDMKRQYPMPKYVPQKEQSEPYIEQLLVSPNHTIHILKSKNIIKKKMKTDVLLATVTPIETKAILDLFPNYQEIITHEKIYFDLGLTNNLQIVLIQQTHMGSNGTAGSHMSIKEAIEALSPLYIIMVGIAFGIDANKYTIGDILVSRYVQDYDPQRVSTDLDSAPKFESRGERVTASRPLLDSFIAAQYSLEEVIWPGKQPKIDFGLILSGSKLVDHMNYRDELRKLAPDAIGGEMEGIGVYHAASDKKIDWIIVKAICDWADGKKDIEKAVQQQLAASNAALFTLHVLQRSSFKHHRYTKKKNSR